MRLQFLSTLLAIVFLLPEMGYSENNSTQNLALGYSFEEEIFIDKSMLEPHFQGEFYLQNVEVGANGHIYARVEDRKDRHDKVMVFAPDRKFIKKVKLEEAEVKFENIKEDCKEDYIVLLPKYAKDKLKEKFGWAIVDCEKDGNGNIYLCLFSSPWRILKYKAQGEKIFEIFVPGGQYIGPVDLEVDDFGNIIVANAAYNTLDIFDNNGRFLYSHEGSFKIEQTADDDMSGLSDMALDEFGNVYVIDHYANHIKKFTFIKKETSFQPKPEDEIRELIVKVTYGGGDRDEMYYAIKSLNRTTDPAAIKALISVFERTEGYGSVLSLASIGKPAIPFLIEALRSPSQNVRLGVLRVLELNNDQRVIIPVLNFLRTAPKHVEGRNVEWREYAAGVFHNMDIDDASIEIFLKALKDEHEDERIKWIAIGVLGRTKVPKHIPILVEVVKKNPHFRSDAADALALIGDKVAVPALIEALNAESDMRNAGIRFMEALGKLKAGEAIDVIIKRGIQNEDLHVRERAVWILGEIGDPKALPALEKLLRTERNGNVRGAISWSMRGLEREKYNRQEEGMEYRQFLPPLPEDKQYLMRIKEVGNVDNAPESEEVILITIQDNIQDGKLSDVEYRRAFLLVCAKEGESLKKKYLLEIYNNTQKEFSDNIEHFYPPHVFRKGYNPFSPSSGKVELVDLNRDGILDVFVKLWSSGSGLSFYVAVVSFQDGDLKTIFSSFAAAGDYWPQYKDIDGDGFYELQIPNEIYYYYFPGNENILGPMWISLYEWDGKKYVLNNQKFYSRDTSIRLRLLQSYTNQLQWYCDQLLLGNKPEEHFEHHEFYLGLIYYYRKEFHLARDYFSRVLKKAKNEDYLREAQVILKQLAETGNPDFAPQLKN